MSRQLADRVKQEFGNAILRVDDRHGDDSVWVDREKLGRVLEYLRNKEACELLADVVGRGNIITGEGRENYAQDEMPRSKPFLPEAVVKPEGVAQVAGMMKLAN